MFLFEIFEDFEKIDFFTIHGASKWEKSGNTEKIGQNVFIMTYNCVINHFQVFLDLPLTKKFFRFFHRWGYRCEKVENFQLFQNSIKTLSRGKPQAKNTILMLKKFENNVKSWSLTYFRYDQLTISHMGVFYLRKSESFNSFF